MIYLTNRHVAPKAPKHIARRQLQQRLRRSCSTLACLCLKLIPVHSSSLIATAGRKVVNQGCPSSYHIRRELVRHVGIGVTVRRMWGYALGLLLRLGRCLDILFILAQDYPEEVLWRRCLEFRLCPVGGFGRARILAEPDWTPNPVSPCPGECRQTQVGRLFVCRVMFRGDRNSVENSERIRRRRPQKVGLRALLSRTL